MNKYLVKQPNHGKLEEKHSIAISRGKVHMVSWYLDEEGYYRDSAIIKADNLDKVFEEGNFPENNDNIELLDTFYSVSVGDVIVNLETKEKHMVDRIGFAKIY